MNTTIRALTAADWPSVAAIYQEGIETGQATFETAVPTWESWDAAHLETGRLVAEVDEQILGWAALTPVSGRCVYAGVAEVSVYVAAVARGQGIGKQLLRALVETSEAEGIWTLQAAMFPENRGSVALHKSLGFRRVGVRKKLGQLQGDWRDVLLMERRSSRVGLE
ncbi:MAG: N-acetyltransferase family protein [Chloroflexota bacterium]